MMIAVMSRVSRNHTGRPLTDSWLASGSYTAIILAVVLLPMEMCCRNITLH